MARGDWREIAQKGRDAVCRLDRRFVELHINYQIRAEE
jgi:hypothetical protein